MDLQVPRILVVTPTYNEAESIPSLLESLFALKGDISVLVVDDNSPDGTSGRVRDCQGRFPRLFLLTRPGKLGLGSAYREGFKFALARGFDIVVQMDADLTHPPEFVTRMIQRLKDADLVIGSRYVQGTRIRSFAWGRRLISRAGNVLAQTLLRLPVHDATSGFRCFRADALRSIRIETTESRGFVFQVETVLRAARRGLRIAEIPIDFFGRRSQRSKFSLGICAEAFLRVVGWALKGQAGR